MPQQGFKGRPAAEVCLWAPTVVQTHLSQQVSTRQQHSLLQTPAGYV